MVLKELEKVLRGYCVVNIEWRDSDKKIKELSTYLHLIKDCSDELLNKEILRLEIKTYGIDIFLGGE